MALAEACEALWRNQENHWAPPQEPHLRPSLREVQVITALKNYLKLKPDDASVHLTLVQIFQSLNFMDAAYDHLQAAYQHLRRAPEETLANFQERQRSLAQILKEAEKDLKKRRDHFDLRSPRANYLQKFAMARGKERDPSLPGGLVLTALNILQEATKDPKFKKLNHDEQKYVVLAQVHLLLMLGRINEVLTIKDDLPKILGLGSLQFEALAAGAIGDYRELDRVLVRMEKELLPSKEFFHPDQIHVFANGPDSPLIGASLGMMSLLIRSAEVRKESVKRGLAEFRTLRGIMMLEQGDTAKAAQFFRDALQTAGRNMHFPDRPIAERYLQLMGRK
jgi:hypothetical protein